MPPIQVFSRETDPNRVAIFKKYCPRFEWNFSFPTRTKIDDILKIPNPRLVFFCMQSTISRHHDQSQCYHVQSQLINAIRLESWERDGKFIDTNTKTDINRTIMELQIANKSTLIVRMANQSTNCNPVSQASIMQKIQLNRVCLNTENSIKFEHLQCPEFTKFSAVVDHILPKCHPRFTLNFMT